MRAMQTQYLILTLVIAAVVIGSAICAIDSCGAQNFLPAQRYKIWDEEARPRCTELCKSRCGKNNADKTQMRSNYFFCRPY